MFDDIKSSYPPITDQLDAADYEFFLNLPQDYRGFLAAHNGGFVDEFRYTFLTGVPFKTEHVDNPSRDDCPVEFFGISTSDASEPDDLLQRVVDHAAEDAAFLAAPDARKCGSRRPRELRSRPRDGDDAFPGVAVAVVDHPHADRDEGSDFDCQLSTVDC